MYDKQVEDVRRKHNYLPLIIEVLKYLSRDASLSPLVAQAKLKARQAKEKERKRKKEVQ